MNEQDKADAFEVARFGITVESFLADDIGSYLMDRAARESGDAINRMKKVDPTDQAAIIALQTALNTPDNIRLWLEQAIQEGLACHFQLRQTEADEDHGDVG